MKAHALLGLVLIVCLGAQAALAADEMPNVARAEELVQKAAPWYRPSTYVRVPESEARGEMAEIIRETSRRLPQGAQEALYNVHNKIFKVNVNGEKMFLVFKNLHLYAPDGSIMEPLQEAYVFNAEGKLLSSSATATRREGFHFVRVAKIKGAAERSLGKGIFGKTVTGLAFLGSLGLALSSERAEAHAAISDAKLKNLAAEALASPAEPSSMQRPASGGAVK